MTTPPRNTVLLTDPRPFQGEAVSLSLVVRDALGSAVDITGWSIQWRLSKVNPTSEQESLLTVDAVVAAGASGELTVSIAGVFFLRNAGAFVQELRRVDVGFEQTLARGPFTLSDSAFVAG